MNFTRFYLPAITLIKVSVGNSLVYRGALMIRAAALLLSLFVQFCFWKASFSSVETVSSYNFEHFFLYIVVANLSYEFTIPNNVMVCNQIAQGELNQFLLLPYNFSHYLYWKLFGDRICFFLVNSIPILFLGSIARTLGLPLEINFSFGQIFLFINFLIGGLLIHYLIDFGIGQLAFWFERSDFLLIFKDIVFRILVGIWFPFEILPQAVQNSFSWLPFQFLAYIPGAILSGREINYKSSTLVMFFWIIFLYVSNQLIWRVGIKKYEAFGS